MSAKRRFEVVDVSDDGTEGSDEGSQEDDQNEWPDGLQLVPVTTVQSSQSRPTPPAQSQALRRLPSMISSRSLRLRSLQNGAQESPTSMDSHSSQPSSSSSVSGASASRLRLTGIQMTSPTTSVLPSVQSTCPSSVTLSTEIRLRSLMQQLPMLVQCCPTGSAIALTISPTGAHSEFIVSGLKFLSTSRLPSSSKGSKKESSGNRDLSPPPTFTRRGALAGSQLTKELQPLPNTSAF